MSLGTVRVQLLRGDVLISGTTECGADLHRKGVNRYPCEYLRRFDTNGTDRIAEKRRQDGCACTAIGVREGSSGGTSHQRRIIDDRGANRGGGRRRSEGGKHRKRGSASDRRLLAIRDHLGKRLLRAGCAG